MNTNQQGEIVKARSHPSDGFKLPMICLAAIAAILALSLWLSTPASALETRLQYAEFGPDGTAETKFNNAIHPTDPNQAAHIAFDQVRDRVYVLTFVDATTSRLYAFDASTEGVYVPLEGYPKVLSAITVTGALMVNGATGHVYVSTSNTAETGAIVYGFDEFGEPLPGWPAEIPGVEVSGGAMDPSGHIWIYDRSALTLRKLGSGGELEGPTINLSGVASANRRVKVLFDANADAYVLTTHSVNGTAVSAFTAASGYTTFSKLPIADLSEGGSMGLDTSTGVLYHVKAEFQPKEDSSIEALTTAGKPLYSFEADQPNTGFRELAIDQSLDSLFVIDNRYETIRVFGPFGPAVSFTLDDAADVTGAHATFSGTVNPEGATLTECRFEYGLTKAYGKSVPCTGSLPADSSPHPITATVSDLLPQGKAYFYRIAVKGATGTTRSAGKSFVTPHTLFSKPATAVTATAATLTATINPDGVPVSECKFEYGTTVLYGQSVPCSPAAAAIPVDSNVHPLTGAVSGLIGGTPYHFRVSATTSAGTFVSEDETFVPLGPPLVFEEEASPVGRTTATLKALVDPRESATSYHFEWGPDDSYGNRIPPEGELAAGAGSNAVAVSTDLSSLDQRRTYHFRVVASNEFGTTEGPDQTFTTEVENSACSNAAIRSAQTSASLPEGPLAFPDCMALEMVSPQKKFNQFARGGAFSANGDRIAFQSVAALADTPRQGSFFDRYIATRTSSGWVTQSTAMPPQYAFGAVAIAAPCAYSPDLSHWGTWASTDTQAKLGITTAFRGELGGPFTPISPLMVPLNSGFDRFAINGSLCQGASSDASHFFFGIKFGLSLETTQSAAAYLPGDPLTGKGNLYEAYLDEAGDPTIELMQRDSAGVVHGGECGALIGTPDKYVTTQVTARGAVSSDASRVFFSAREGQVEGSSCDKSKRFRIFERLRTPSGVEINQAVQNECDRVSPPCSAIDGDDVFQAASQEGDLLYFMTPRQLADSDLDTGNDLYLLDRNAPSGERLTQISVGDATDATPGADADVLGVPDVAGDGSRAYFVAEDQLTAIPNRIGKTAQLGQPNLYSYELDVPPSDRLRFVATLDHADAGTTFQGTWKTGPGSNEAVAVPVLGSDLEDQSVGGDGHVLVFRSEASLLPADDDGGFADLYRYDANTGALALVTKAAPGGSDGAPIAVPLLRNLNEAGPQAFSFDRRVSEDGRTVVFSTTEALDPEDDDGKENPYIWRDGTLKVIPFLGDDTSVSLDGRSVVFAPFEQLLPEDGDGAQDIYVLRVDGGFPIPDPPTPCIAEECQGPPSARPGDLGAASAGVTAGNLAPAKPCRKGFVRRKGRCVKRPPKHRKHGKHGQRRAGQKQGGRK